MRIAEGCEAEPTAGIIDRQSVKTTEADEPRGYDADNRINGRKRHTATDTAVSMLDGLTRPAAIQDRDGAPEFIERCREVCPLLSRFFADAGYAEQELEATIAHLDCLAIEVIRRCNAHCFVVLPRRWVVEPTIAWLNRCRRLAKAWEAFVASIRRMARHIAKLEL